jgi:hypothetical protein
MSNKQNSIDWLIEQFYANEGMITTKQLEQAKAMNEKELEDYFKRGENNYKRGYKPITFKEFHNGYSKDGKE